MKVRGIYNPPPRDGGNTVVFTIIDTDDIGHEFECDLGMFPVVLLALQRTGRIAHNAIKQVPIDERSKPISPMIVSDFQVAPVTNDDTVILEIHTKQGLPVQFSMDQDHLVRLLETLRTFAFR